MVGARNALYALVVRRTEWIFASLATVVVAGLVGASAFNPDNGFLAHSTLLWRVFGISFEAGGIILVLGIVATALMVAVDGLRSRRA